MNSTPSYRPTWWTRWCLPCDAGQHDKCAGFDPTYDCDCADDGHPDITPDPSRSAPTAQSAAEES